VNICYELAPTEQISFTTFNIIIATANHIIPRVNPIFVNKANAAIKQSHHRSIAVMSSKTEMNVD
jgi:hypothetical protein